ncbi:T6SS immunity protein Tli4 family protein [Massilia consociata]|uniref:T6SS immunity protein Tli4 family protein n=1 Tax=Massilia consociata TaxID=760117 RepID=A0ABV6FEK8_9BURK
MTLVSLFANSVQTIQDRQKVAQMTDKMKTVCVGRFLIDLPVDAQVNIKRGFVGGFDLSSSIDETDAEFSARLSETETKFAQGRTRDGRPNLESAKVLAIGAARGKTLVHNRRKTKVPDGDRMTFSEDVSVRSLLRFPGLSITADVDWIAPEQVDDIERILSRISPLAAGEVPREKGFCIGHAMLRDPYEHLGTEHVVLFAGLPGHPDVNIVLSSMAGTIPGPGLLERHASAAEREPFYMKLAFTTLRERQRSINGLQGEELALRVREPNLTTGYSFQWEMPGKHDDVYAPLLTLELDAGTNPQSGGKPVQSSLSEEALIELWERIANSVRLRPTADAPVVEREVIAAALGTNALAGEVCPHSGWWQCGDGGDGVGVFGGQRQFLKAGQRMPQALLMPPQTLWQRLRGVQPSYESRNPTIWKLVDKRSSARLPQPPMLANAVSLTESSSVPAGTVPYGLSEAPLGSVAKTGTACPASGWWRCEDSHALDGTRWFAAGSLLPAATFRTPMSGRGSTHPEYIHRRSAWQLVRHAPAGEQPGGHAAEPPGYGSSSA